MKPHNIYREKFVAVIIQTPSAFKLWSKHSYEGRGQSKFQGQQSKRLTNADESSIDL